VRKYGLEKWDKSVVGKIHWETPVNPPTLTEDEVHIWRVDLSHPNENLDINANDLSVDERTRAERFQFERDRRCYILSHSRLHRLLGGYLGIEPAAISFESTERGKPHLGGQFSASGLEFNLAHSGEMALFGFRWGVGIGVDIEQVRTMPDLDRLAARYFSKVEQEQLSQLPANKKVDGFFKCWTCKEAFIKNIGDGLYYPLNLFDVDVDPDLPGRLLRVASDLHEASSWRLEYFTAWEGYSSALAVRGEVGRVRYLDLDH
jgi:4'-phosphopantetheinyl transferase